jgi:RNA polymerase sigma-70 factor (ECF subfamily)
MVRDAVDTLDSRPPMRIPDKLAERLHRQAQGDRWRVPVDRFVQALDASAERACAGRDWDAKDLERYLASLHLEDLALACACAEGHDDAWEHFVREQRPLLYRAADALDASGGARELADSLYADLFGLANRSGERQSLFRYFHGRSSLTTWLRAVLAQRFVDRMRSDRRIDPLPDEDSSSALPAPARAIEPDRDHYLHLIRTAFERAVAGLPSRDRLRLTCYYAQDLTLAQTGRMLGEHEATVSRQIARARRTIRETVERDLRDTAGLSGAEIARCFECVTEDPGTLDLGDLLDVGSVRKKPTLDRST